MLMSELLGIVEWCLVVVLVGVCEGVDFCVLFIVCMVYLLLYVG